MESKGPRFFSDSSFGYFGVTSRFLKYDLEREGEIWCEITQLADENALPESNSKFAPEHMAGKTPQFG